MGSRITGAGLRAALTASLLAAPHLLLGAATAEGAQLAALLALLAAALVASEYAGRAPLLVGFRDARPFNRLRFGAAMATILLLSVMLGAGGEGSTGVLALRALGAGLGDAADFALSPPRLLAGLLPPGEGAAAPRRIAGAAYAASLLMVAAFAWASRGGRWPRTGTFNPWINLPRFDPTGGDAAARLRRDARVNLALGALLPFLLPMAAVAVGGPLGMAAPTNPAALVWMVTAWALIPASLLMRGLALRRVAAMTGGTAPAASTFGVPQPA